MVRLARIRKSASGSSSSRAARLRLAQQLDRGRRVLAPGERDRERRRGVDLLGAGDRIAGARDLDRVAGEALRLGEDAVEHLELGERGQDRRAFRDSARAGRARPPAARRASPRPDRRRHGGCGPAVRGADRAARGRAGRRGHRSPIRGRPSRATSGRPRRPPPRHGPGGRPGPRRAPPVAWPVRPVRGPSGSDSASSSDGQLVGRGVAGAGERGRLDRR